MTDNSITHRKRLIVLGGGESGVGAAILGKEKGMDVFLSDYGNIPNATPRSLKRKTYRSNRASTPNISYSTPTR